LGSQSFQKSALIVDQSYGQIDRASFFLSSDQGRQEKEQHRQGSNSERNVAGKAHAKPSHLTRSQLVWVKNKHRRRMLLHLWIDSEVPILWVRQLRRLHLHAVIR